MTKIITVLGIHIVQNASRNSACILKCICSYTIQPFSDQGMLWTDQCKQLVDHFCQSYCNFVISHYNIIATSLPIYHYHHYATSISPSSISPSSYRRRIDSTCMRKVEHCASCLPWLSIVGYSLSCNEVSAELQYEQRFPGKDEESIIHYL